MSLRDLGRSRALAATAFMAFVGPLAMPLSAAPLFGFPFATHPPGFVVHLLPIGPVPFPPASAIAAPFGDALVSPPEPHHWEIELNNFGTAVTSSNVSIAIPGGGVAFLGNITLFPGGSVYWDIHYADIPEVGPYLFQAFNPAGGVPFWSLDTSVIEYQQIPGGPAPIDSGPIFLGPGGIPGGFAGAFLPGAPTIFLVIPEPSILLAGIGGIAALAVAGGRIWRKRKST